MKTIDTLVPDIQALFTEEFKPDGNSLEEFGSKLSAHIGKRIGEERGTPGLRLSNLGTPCERKLWYSINAPETAEQLGAEARFKFLYGDILEELLLHLADQAGHTVEGQQDELDLFGVKGHRDAVIDGVLVDVKSASTYSFNKFASGLKPEDDSFGYLTQLDGYLHADKRDLGAFLVVDKTLGKLTIDYHPRSSKNYEEVIDAKRRMLDHSTPPARGYRDVPEGKSGNRKLGIVCSYCNHKHHCWPELRSFAYSSGPVWFTHIERIPKVNEF